MLGLKQMITRQQSCTLSLGGIFTGGVCMKVFSPSVFRSHESVLTICIQKH